MAYLLFIEQDVGTHLYITDSHSIYAVSSLFIMIIYHKTKCIEETFIYIITCDKGHNLVICCIAPTEIFQSSIRQNRSMGPKLIGYLEIILKISLLKVLLCSFHQCEKFQNMEFCTVVFCMFQTKYLCISLESILPIY